MYIWAGYNGNKKVVSFNTQDRLDDKIDTLTSMSKLTAQGSSQNRPLSLKFTMDKADD